MRKLKTVLAERDDVQAKLQANLAKSNEEDRPLTEDEKKTHDELLAKLKALRLEGEEIRQLEAEIEANAKLRAPEEPERKEVTPVTVTENRPKGLFALRMMQSIAAFKSSGISPAAFAEERLRDPEVAKALAAGTASAGGTLVPAQYSSEIIELLRPMTSVRRLGARTVPVPFGTLNLPRIASGSSAGYIGENGSIGVSTMETGNVQFTLKKLASLVPISNELLRNPTPDVEMIVRDDMVAGLSVTEDAAFLRNQGVAGAPKGLRYQAASGNVLSMTGSVTIATIDTDLGRLETALRAANVPMIQPGYIFAPRVSGYLKNLRSTTGDKVFPEMADGTLRGYPYTDTSNVPVNLGGGTESEVYFADFAQVLIGDRMGIMVDVSSEATYVEGGVTKSAFQYDQTLVRVIMEHDLQVRHTSAIAILTGVTWGA